MDTTSRRQAFPLRRNALVLAASLVFATIAVPVFAADAQPVSIAGNAPLAPGAYEWTPEVSASGPVTIVVSLPEQMVHVYRGDMRIGRATISSGKPGHDTPPGVYEILEKDRMHRSNKYNDAPMPYMQRLTWDGIALHSGRNPGYPASHGCIRLPDEFAAELFEVTERGGRVIVADETNFGEAVLYPGDRVPVDPWTGLERNASDRMANATAVPATTTAATSAAPVSQAIVSSQALAGN
jgi:lipoprotein-anchoring transpeptidase ErfK/SrfK